MFEAMADSCAFGTGWSAGIGFLRNVNAERLLEVAKSILYFDYLTGHRHGHGRE